MAWKIDTARHKALAGHTLCVFCNKVIKTGVGIIQFPNGFCMSTHKHCLEDAQVLVFQTKLANGEIPEDVIRAARRALGLE
jgi:hypothetical protein